MSTKSLERISLFCLLISACLWSCKRRETTVNPEVVVQKTTGEWIDPATTTPPNSISAWASGDVIYSPRNFHYTFEAQANKPYSFTVSSTDIPVGVAVFDASKNKVAYSTGYSSSSPCNFTALSAGTYEVMISANQRGRVGKFTLQSLGLANALIPVTYTKLTSPQIPQPFTPDGGGGQGYSPKNQLYTFDLTKSNEPFDINVVATTNTIWLEVYGPSGKKIATTTYYRTGPVVSYVSDKTNDELLAGTYKVWVGTEKRDDPIGTRFEVMGSVANLKLAVPQSASISNTIQEVPCCSDIPSQLYEINVISDNTPFDLAIKSADVSVKVVLLDVNGSAIKTIYSANTPYTTTNLNKGTYRLNVSTNNYGSHKGTYTLTAYGQIAPTITKL